MNLMESPPVFNDGLKKMRYLRSFLLRRMVHINLQLSYDCNFQCSICDFWKDEFRNYPRLSLPQVRFIAEKLKKLGPQIISIGGGEPLMHPDIVPICETLSKDHFAVMICNGWFVTPETARALFRAGLYEISISVDYADPQTHDAQRAREGAFNRAIQALRVLYENRIHPHQRVHMISVIMDDNIDHIERLILLARKLGITYLVTLYSDNRGNRERKATRPDLGEHLLELKMKYPEFVALRGYLSRFSEALRSNGISPCYAGRNLLNIDSQGNVTPCIDNLQDSSGNIFNDDLSSILANLMNSRAGSACAGCWTSCRGSMETAMYGKNRAANLFDYYQMTKNIPLLPNAGGRPRRINS